MMKPEKYWYSLGVLSWVAALRLSWLPGMWSHADETCAVDEVDWVQFVSANELQ